MVHEYIGSKITIISRNDKRYEGVLHSIDVEKSTITLKDVRYFENGPDGVMGPASSTVFEMIVFRGSDITDLAVCQPVSTTLNDQEIPDDPAILSVNGGSSYASNQTMNRDASSNNLSQQQRSYAASASNHRGSPKMSYSNAVSGGRHGNNSQGGGQNKDNSKNRQRNNGYSGRPYRAGGGPGTGPGTGGSGTGGPHHYTNGSHQRSFVVGELKPRINQALKAELDTEFDFSEQNKKFEKTINGGFSPIHSEKGVKLEGSTSGQGDQFGTTRNGVGLGGCGSSGVNDSIEIDQSNKLTVGGYNKGSGFFDSISCETLDPERSKRMQGGAQDPQIKAMRERQKLIDKETFGVSALKPRPGSYNRGPNHRRGGGAGGNRGGYQSSHRFNRREA